MEQRQCYEGDFPRNMQMMKKELTSMEIYEETMHEYVSINIYMLCDTNLENCMQEKYKEKDYSRYLTINKK